MQIDRLKPQSVILIVMTSCVGCGTLYILKHNETTILCQSVEKQVFSKLGMFSFEIANGGPRAKWLLRALIFHYRS